jgi:DNA-binding transcriptional MocR family regulator
VSLEAMAWAFKQHLPAAEKLVLLSLADHHNGGTGLCIPGQRSIADQTSLSVRTVQRCLQQLEDRGLIERRARFRPEGRGRTSDTYILQGDILSGRSDQPDKPRTTKATSQDDQGDGIGVAEPEENRKKNRKKATTSAMAENWQPDPANWERIVTTIKGIDHATELENFRDHWLSKDERRADWNASLRNWMRNAKAWQKVNPADPPKNPTRLVGPNGYTFCQDCNTPWEHHTEDACIMMQEAMNG